MAHDWLADAQAALTGADDRVAVSESCITELLDAAIDPVALPQRWTIDRGRLPKALADKLARREAKGLPVPLHAHGASVLAAYNEAEWKKMQWRYINAVSDRHRRFVPPEPSPDQPLEGPITNRQLAELRARLPHTENTSTPTESRSAVGKVVDRFPRRFPTSPSLIMLLLFLLPPLLLFLIVGPVAGLVCMAVEAVFVDVVEDLAHSRTALTGHDYRLLEQASVAEPGPEPGTPEYQLAQIAAALAAQITACPAWSSDDLSVHRIQLDPDAEAAQITAHAAEISRVRATLGPAPDGDSDAALRARAHRAGDEQILATVTASLTRRIAALYRYAAELSALNDDYLALESVERSLTASGHLETLIRQTGGDELTVRHLDRLTADARDLHAAITTRLQVLTGDLTALHTLPAGPDEHRA